MIRRHYDDIVACTQTRHTNHCLQALNGLLQGAEREACGDRRFRTIPTVLFVIAGKLAFASLSPHAR